MFRTSRVVLVVLAGALAASPLWAQSTQPTTPVAIENTNAAFVPSEDNTPEANPSRPSITLPARIPPTGYLQFEQGFNEADEAAGGIERQASLNQSVKIALTTRIMTQLISQPYSYNVNAAAPGAPQTFDAPGDLLFGIEGIVHKSTGPAPTVALQYFRRLREGTSDSLDPGEDAQGAMLMLRGDLPGSFHYDSNEVVWEQSSGPVRRAEYQQTLAVTHPVLAHRLQGRLTEQTELSHFTQPFITSDAHGRSVAGGNTVGLLQDAEFALRPYLVLDMSVEHGLTSTSTQWQGGFGVTYLLPHRLWPDRHPRALAVRPYRYPQQ